MNKERKKIKCDWHGMHDANFATAGTMRKHGRELLSMYLGISAGDLVISHLSQSQNQEESTPRTAVKLHPWK